MKQQHTYSAKNGVSVLLKISRYLSKYVTKIIYVVSGSDTVLGRDPLNVG